jgi:hypothetical protein
VSRGDDHLAALLADVPPPRALSDVEVERIAQSLTGRRRRRASASRARRWWLGVPLAAALVAVLLLGRGRSGDLRVAAGDTVALSNANGATVTLAGPARLAYGRTWSDAPRLYDGTATLTTGARSLRLRTATAAIEVSPDGRVVVTALGPGVRVAAYSGTVTIEWQGVPVRLRAGQEARSDGGAIELVPVERAHGREPGGAEVPRAATSQRPSAPTSPLAPPLPSPLLTLGAPSGPAADRGRDVAAHDESRLAPVGRLALHARVTATLPHLPEPGSAPTDTETPPAPSSPATAATLLEAPSSAAPSTTSALAAETELLTDALDALRHDHRPDRALALLDRHRDRFVDGPLAADAERLRLDALFDLGRTGEALDVLDRLALDVDRSGRGRELRLARAELRAAAGRWSDARADFDAVLAAITPTGTSAAAGADAVVERALYGSAACLLALGDRDGARVTLRRYLDRFPGGAHAAAARRLLAR